MPFLVRLGKPNLNHIVFKIVYTELCHFRDKQQSVRHNTAYRRVVDTAERAV